MERERRAYPEEERFFVLRDGTSLGPFGIEDLLEALETGEVDYGDLCLREGGGPPEPLSDVLDWEDGPGGGRGEASGGIAWDEDEEEDEEDGADEDDPGAGGARRRRAAQREPLLFRGHPSVLTFPFALLSLAGGLGGALWAHAWDVRLSIALFAIAVFALGYLVLMRYLREYFITSRRVETVSGLVARSSKEVRIADIRAINVTCRGFSGLLGIGTVDFFTTGDRPEVVFLDAWAAARIKRLVRDLQDGPLD